ncbi:PID-CTERM protein-sorting domain-containing protein [Bizionia arctica]|uniref:PID-CTERM protein-sorting domain-containing protein n=1 Tax=Bizionia arctica TaxID=1495645 RepID=UPI001E3364F8|nr:hypothetical protein [Bizionia arctica]
MNKIHLIDVFYLSWIFFVVFILLSRFFLYFYNQMKIQNKKIVASILFLLISFVCVAQDMPQPPAPPPPPGLPIDGGLLAGLFVGLVLGVKKLLKR